MLQFSFRNSGLTAKQFQQYAKSIQKYWDVLCSIPRHIGYDRTETSMNLCDNRRMVRSVQNLAAKYKKNSLVVVVGIGGSNLGTQAVYEALRSQETRNSKQEAGGRILFADTVDSFKTKNIVRAIKMARSQKRQIILNIVSKSGGTTETVMNAELLKKLAGPFEKKDVVVTTDENSSLWKLSEAIGYTLLAIPSVIGGRYSVFTPVGLFPLAVAGVDIQKLLVGAKWARDLSLKSSASSPALKSATTLYHWAKNGHTINDNFFFRTDLESLGKWYRQLMGESIGKDGKGMTPTVSIGSTDLHSMGQLCLGGPQDKVTTFVSVNDSGAPMLGKKTVLGSLVGGVIDSRSTDEVLQAILKGTQAAYVDKNHPFIDVVMDRMNEESLGAYMQWKMIEMMLLGKLFGVDAFDQPNVEEYKAVTKKLLHLRAHAH